ncbi:MAG: DUF2007 domain-containing protein [Anaerolineaceae bacterium]|nr:DUF2007 domain-containing protein [Anaerolineaceae bacterium]
MMTSSLSDMVSVYNAQGRLDGEMVKAFLEANGIRVILTQEGAAAAYGLTVGAFANVEVLVDKVNETTALALINSMEDGEFSDTDIITDSDTD